MFPQISPRFEAYIAPARARPELWRLVLGAALATLIYFATSLFLVSSARSFGLDLGAVLEGRGGPVETLVILSSFAGLAVGVIVAARLFQNRRLADLLGPDLRAFRLHFAVAATAILTLGLLAQAVSLSFSRPENNMPLATWLAWLPLSLILVLVQSGAEELGFRGYLQTQLAARFRSPWFWWVLPSLLFGLLHYDPEGFGPNAWLVVADTALFGLVAADVTARTGNLGAAIGMHFVNNALAILFIAPAEDMNGLALHVTAIAADDWTVMRNALLGDMAVIVLGYLIYLYAMRRRGL